MGMKFKFKMCIKIFIGKLKMLDHKNVKIKT